jgi:hypothetical protein
MAVPDIANLSKDELTELITTANLAYQKTLVEDKVSVAEKKIEIGEAIAELQALLGPEGASPSLNSIRGVLGFTDQQLAENSGLAFRLILLGMEQLTKTTLDLAEVISK